MPSDPLMEVFDVLWEKSDAEQKKALTRKIAGTSFSAHFNNIMCTLPMVNTRELLKGSPWMRNYKPEQKAALIKFIQDL